MQHGNPGFGRSSSRLFFGEWGFANTDGVTLPMTDYYRLIARAVADLKNADATRRAALYGCARAALVNQLSGFTPPLDEAEIRRERLSLEAAIREIEADAMRRSGTDAASIDAMNTQLRQMPPSPDHGRLPTARPDPFPSATRPPRAKGDESGMREPEPRTGHRAGNRELPPLSARALEALKVYRETVAEADRFGEAELSPRQACADPGDISERTLFDAGIEPDDTPIVPRHGPFPAAFEVERRTYSPSPPMAQRATIKIIARVASRRSLRAPLLAVLGMCGAAAMAVLLYWQWDRLNTAFLTDAAIPAEHDAARSPLEVVGDIGQASEQRSSNIGRTSIASAQAPAPQRAVLYEEDPADPAGKRHAGSVTWRTEPSSSDQPLAIRAQLEIPERRMSMTMSLRPNSEKALPASHTIELVFKLPTDFPFGGISNVLGILMKRAEEVRGVPLAVSTVKITTGMFLIGLSAVDSDMQRNRELLEAQSWFDVPIVYENGRRAILAIEKGAPGEDAFKEALAAWQ